MTNKQSDSLIKKMGPKFKRTEIEDRPCVVGEVEDHIVEIHFLERTCSIGRCGYHIAIWDKQDEQDCHIVDGIALRNVRSFVKFILKLQKEGGVGYRG